MDSCFDGRAECCANRLQAEDEHERLVNGSKLVRVKSSCGSTEPLGIDDGRLLDENARLLPRDRDRRSEARCTGTSRSRGHEHGAQAEELVGLHDDRVTGSLVCMPARVPGRRESERFSTDHVSRLKGQCPCVW